MEPAAAGDEKSKQQRSKNFSSPRRRSTMDQKQLASSFGCFICKGPHLQRVCPTIGQGKKIACWRCGDPDHLVARCAKPRKKKFSGSGGNVNVFSAKASRGDGTGGPCGVGNRGHLASSTRKVSQVKSSLGTGPGRGTAVNTARSNTGGGTTLNGVILHGSRGECSLDGGRPLQDSRPRGSKDTSRSPVPTAAGPSSAVPERRQWAQPSASAEPPGRQ